MPFIEHLLCGEHFYTFTHIIILISNACFLAKQNIWISESHDWGFFCFSLYFILYFIMVFSLLLRLLWFDTKMCRFWVCSAKNSHLSSYEPIFLLWGKSNDEFFPRSHLVNQCSVFCILWCKNGSWQMWLKRPHT